MRPLAVGLLLGTTFLCAWAFVVGQELIVLGGLCRARWAWGKAGARRRRLAIAVIGATVLVQTVGLWPVTVFAFGLEPIVGTTTWFGRWVVRAVLSTWFSGYALIVSVYVLRVMPSWDADELNRCRQWASPLIIWWITATAALTICSGLTYWILTEFVYPPAW